jgi:urease accessory protein
VSINISFKDDQFEINKLQLPTRYYYFNDVQNYIKLLSIGEGIFPKDRIKTHIKLQNSDSIFTTESATKVYPSRNIKDEYGINQINIELQNSNLEFINDELILYKDAKLLGFLKVKADSSSTFFYGDILSHGRSFENFDFSAMGAKNSFYCNEEIEYLEKYQVKGDSLKEYIKRQNSKNYIFGKVYIKTNDNEKFLDLLYSKGIESISYTQNKKMLVGVVSGDNMAVLKRNVLDIWDSYREFLNKNKFNLGKQ